MQTIYTVIEQLFIIAWQTVYTFLSQCLTNIQKASTASSVLLYKSAVEPERSVGETRDVD